MYDQVDELTSNSAVDVQAAPRAIDIPVGRVRRDWIWGDGLGDEQFKVPDPEITGGLINHEPAVQGRAFAPDCADLNGGVVPAFQSARESLSADFRGILIGSAVDPKSVTCRDAMFAAEGGSQVPRCFAGAISGRKAIGGDVEFGRVGWEGVRGAGHRETKEVWQMDRGSLRDGFLA